MNTLSFSASARWLARTSYEIRPNESLLPQIIFKDKPSDMLFKVCVDGWDACQNQTTQSPQS